VSSMSRPTWNRLIILSQKFDACLKTRLARFTPLMQLIREDGCRFVLERDKELAFSQSALNWYLPS
jgi:hypothetical protein